MKGKSSEDRASDLRVLRSRRVMIRRGTEDANPREPKPKLPASAPSLPSSSLLSPHLGTSSSRLRAPAPRPGDAAMSEIMCEICGSGSDRDLIAECAECSSYQHRYCMPVVAFSIPPQWLCSECQEKANGNSIPNQGGQNELQSACSMTNERETPKLDLGHSNVDHQISPDTRKISSGKVKFISSEEVASLNRDRRPYGRSSSAMRQNQLCSMSPSLKQCSYMKGTPPTRGDTQTPALTQCTAASHGHEKIERCSDVETRQSQVRSASLNLIQSSSMKCVSPSRSATQGHSPLKRSVPASHDKAIIEKGSEFAAQKSQLPHASSPNVKQPFNGNCIFPSRSDTQAHAQRHCIAASYYVRKKDLSMKRNIGHGSSMPTIRSRTDVAAKEKVDSQMEHNIVSADKGKFTCQVQHEHREKETFCASVEATGCESKIWSPSHNKGTLLIMGSSAEYSRRPAPEICWTGCFLVLYAGTKHNLGEFKAYFPSKVLDRIYNITKAMPTTLEFEMLPRMDDWPTTFGITPPTYGDIGMFFLSNKFDGHEKKDPDLLETSCNYVMRAYIDDIKLLIYSSELLPPDSQWVDGKSYLWGIFVRPARKRSHRHLSSTST